MATTVARELCIDHAATARSMTEAFGFREPISAMRLEWLYNRAFSSGTTVISLRDGSCKVGQIALVRQPLLLEGKHETAAQLVDLFVLPPYRGKQSLRQLYDEVEREFIKQGIRFAIGMPNGKALGVNAHFLNLQPHLTLPFSLGVCLPRRPSREILSLQFDPLDRHSLLSLFAQFCGGDGNGLLWKETMLFDRLLRPGRRYGIHVAGDLLLISSRRRSRSLDHTLLCGFLVRPGCRASESELGKVVQAACRMWRRRLYVYVGTNDKLPGLPGLVMPKRLRPSPMLVQLRDFRPGETPPFRLDRYELIDFDYA
jgi:GNAT superfamily N-acetyltransferase